MSLGTEEAKKLLEDLDGKPVDFALLYNWSFKDDDIKITNAMITLNKNVPRTIIIGTLKTTLDRIIQEEIIEAGETIDNTNYEELMGYLEARRKVDEEKFKELLQQSS